jgi:hypothetical protein
VPGLGRALLAALSGDSATASLAGHSIAGQLCGAVAVARGRRVEMITFTGSA